MITLYLEGISDGRRFVEQAGLVAQEKPIIALKVGRFASGQRAVASHTGALAGRDSAFTAAFRRAGVIRAETSEEMFEWARALAWCPLPKGRDIAVLTNAGGPGVTAADALEVNGMRLAMLSEQTQAALGTYCHPLPACTTRSTCWPPPRRSNMPQPSPILGDPGVHGALVILAPPPMYTAGAVAKALIPVIHNADKPVVVALMGERLIQEAVEHFRAAHVPEYRFPERAASALAILAQRAEFLERNPEQPAQFTDTNPQAVHEILEEYAKKSPASESPGILPQDVTARILEAYGIATLPIELASSADQAAEIAERMGYPVALKVASQDIPHKSDIGGVLLNLEDRQAVLQGFSNITESAQRARPDAEILGVHVQHMIPHGQEVIVGSVFDEQFGPLVMFGSGGVEVEGLKDVSFALAPMRRQDADHLLETTWAGKKLRGYRNLPPGDREAVVETLLRLAQLAVDFPRLAEIEINPLRVLCEGQGAFAIDTRLTLRI